MPNISYFMYKYVISRVYYSVNIFRYPTRFSNVIRDTARILLYSITNRNHDYIINPDWQNNGKSEAGSVTNKGIPFKY